MTKDENVASHLCYVNSLKGKAPNFSSCKFTGTKVLYSNYTLQNSQCNTKFGITKFPDMLTTLQAMQMKL